MSNCLGGEIGLEIVCLMTKLLELRGLLWLNVE